VQKSAEVVVVTLESQSRHEGPNDEEQGGDIGNLTARESFLFGGNHRFIVPTGIDRRGACRETSLE
jgi:hypothetical protein